jgi:Helicase HerA, central domain
VPSIFFDGTGTAMTEVTTEKQGQPRQLTQEELRNVANRVGLIESGQLSSQATGLIVPSEFANINLRPLTFHSRCTPQDGNLALWGLVNSDLNQSHELTLTYMIRQERGFAVNLKISKFDRANVKARSHKNTTRSKLHTTALFHAASLALPGFVQSQKREDLLRGKAAKLLPPSLDVLAAVPRGENPRMPQPKLVEIQPQHALLLPRIEPLTLDVDQALLTLTQLEMDVDLVLHLQHAVMPAETRRALLTAQQILFTEFFSKAHSSANGSWINWKLLRLARWLRSDASLQINAQLRFKEDVDPAAVRMVAAMLYDFNGHDIGQPDGSTDLSGHLIAGDRPPTLTPDPELVKRLLGRSPQRRAKSRNVNCLKLGRDESGASVSVGSNDLNQHMYIVGATGVGKTSLLQSLIQQDIAAGRGVFLIDPHGDLFEEMRSTLPDSILRQAVLANVAECDKPFTLNILEVDGPYPAIQRSFIANQLIALFKHIYGANKDAFGPMFEAYFRGAVLLLMEAEGSSASLADLERVFGDAAYRRGLLDRCPDEQVVQFWKNIALRASGEASLENIAPYILSKLAQLTGNALIRPIICSKRSSLDIPAALESGRLVMVNLAKGIAGGPDAALLGGIITIRLFASAMARSRLPVIERRPVRVYLDEFQTHASHILGEMLAEARKFGLSQTNRWPRLISADPTSPMQFLPIQEACFRFASDQKTRSFLPNGLGQKSRRRP